MNRRETLKTIAVLIVGACTNPLAGCRKPASVTSTADISPGAQNLMAQLSETILPQTDTPGARDTGVDRFLIRALNDCYAPKERERFIADLNAFEEGCFSRFGCSFLKCTAAQQLLVVQDLDREAFGLWSKIKSKVFHYDHFFKTLKRLCVIGYFTSRDGATKALSYDPIPGKWSGCFEMKPGQKGWAAR